MFRYHLFAKIRRFYTKKRPPVPNFNSDIHVYREIFFFELAEKKKQNNYLLPQISKRNFDDPGEDWYMKCGTQNRNETTRTALNARDNVSLLIIVV